MSSAFTLGVKVAAARARERHLQAQYLTHLPVEERVRMYRSGLQGMKKSRDVKKGVIAGSGAFGLSMLGVPGGPGPLMRAINQRAADAYAKVHPKLTPKDIEFLRSNNALVRQGKGYFFNPGTLPHLRIKSNYLVDKNPNALSGTLRRFINKHYVGKLGGIAGALGTGAALGTLMELAKYRDLGKSDAVLAKKLTKGDLGRPGQLAEISKYLLLPMAVSSAPRTLGGSFENVRKLLKLK